MIALALCLALSLPPEWRHPEYAVAGELFTCEAVRPTVATWSVRLDGVEMAPHVGAWLQLRCPMEAVGSQIEISCRGQGVSRWVSVVVSEVPDA